MSATDLCSSFQVIARRGLTIRTLTGRTLDDRHNGGALSVIKACIEALPGANSIAYFDTSFHRSMPEHISMYAIRQDVAKRRGLKKYGFHGLSCARFIFLISQTCRVSS